MNKCSIINNNEYIECKCCKTIIHINDLNNHKKNCFFINYSCGNCSNIFLEKSELIIHQNRKNNQYKYCKFCNQRFKKTYYLTKHLNNKICK